MMWKCNNTKAIRLILSLAVAFGVSGCDMWDMYYQPKMKQLRESDFFSDRRSARPLVEGTVPQGGLREDTVLYTGKEGSHVVDTPPFSISETDLARGKQRFEIYCTPCHDRTGNGNGVVVKRGYNRPADYHSDRLRSAPLGHFVDVIANGFGAMPSYAVQVEPSDRWRIAAYIRALQLSQHATLDMVPEDKKPQLNSEK